MIGKIDFVTLRKLLVEIDPLGIANAREHTPCRIVGLVTLNAGDISLGMLQHVAQVFSGSGKIGAFALERI